MCFKAPKAPPVAAQPTRDSTNGFVTDQARKVASQGGVDNNIFTSALGDSQYGQSAVKLAKLGAAK